MSVYRRKNRTSTVDYTNASLECYYPLLAVGCVRELHNHTHTRLSTWPAEHIPKPTYTSGFKLEQEGRILNLRSARLRFEFIYLSTELQTKPSAIHPHPQPHRLILIITWNNHIFFGACFLIRYDYYHVAVQYKTVLIWHPATYLCKQTLLYFSIKVLYNTVLCCVCERADEFPPHTI